MALEHASVALCEKETNAEAHRLFIVLVNEMDRSGRSKCWPCEFTTYRADITNDHSSLLKINE